MTAAGRATGLLPQLAALTDRLDAAHPSGPGPVAQAWAVVRLVGVGLATPVLVPLVGLLAARHTARTRRDLAALPGAVGDLADGATASEPFHRVGRLPAEVRLVVTSDLHRSVRGRTDLPRRLDALGVYAALLDHYGERGWHLAEDGDVEDLWMVGGSTWGVAYDLGRLLGSVVPGRAGRRWRTRLVGAHLRRVVAANDDVYARIQDGFHLHGRYHRLVGNHDDALADDDVAHHLRLHHPGLEVLDALVVGGGDGPCAVITHGHQVDAWNAPGRAWLGRLATWLACAVDDLPVLGVSPAVPEPAVAERLLAGEQPDVLTAVSRATGTNRDLYSVDEVLALQAFRRRWGRPGIADLDDGPALVLGHSHLPLASPAAPGDAGRWRRYWNSGTGVLPGMVTAVEWDGGAVGADGWPAPRLVAWTWASAVPDAEPVATAPDGRGVVRVELAPTSDGRLAPLHPGVATGA